ncbi:Ig-like domain-containing protein [Vibrio sp. 99-8-1]|uniref:Ig-like domain-containing protein n=1 Tax=Vibrio sp. 99-8-1 TaxID=2607602 RepID=UPI0014937F29|nr:Ig-like domain-containing protein [Vibrio sp. 99-8-1]NOI65030.1 DUF1566 domain-containing protein [Vibrio sp. 99-8-1]
MREVYKHLFAIVVLPLVMLLTGCNSEGAFSGPTVALQRIDITASPRTKHGLSRLTLAVSNKQPFSAIGYYSDNSSRMLTDFNVNDWHSSDEDIGCFDAPGILTGVETGNITVTVSKDGVISNSVSVDVTAAMLTDIAVTPSIVSVAKNQTQQLIATATYSDNSSSDVSGSVTWTSADTSTVTVTPSGLLTGIEVDTTTVTANKDGITSNMVNINVTAAVPTAITLTPSVVSVAKGQTKQLIATEIYSDSSSSDVSDLVAWTPVDTSTATITSTGLLKGVEIGHTTVTAVKDGITSNSISVDVTEATITDIVVTPSIVGVAKGQTEQLAATATYSDNSSSDVSGSVIWTPLDTSTAIVTPTGLLTGIGIDNTLVTATKDSITSNEVNVEVTTAVLTDITVTPSIVGIAIGKTQQLAATATYSDDSSSDVTRSVTWKSANTSTVTVTPSGLLTGIKSGTTTVTATKDSITSNTANADVCRDLAGSCIDTFDTGSGKLFTNSPSVAYLNSIGGSATSGSYTDGGSWGPAGDFYQFTWHNANSLCAKYNTQKLAGRDNWRLATRYELEIELIDTYGNMFIARNWPIGDVYWSMSPIGYSYYYVALNSGYVSNNVTMVSNSASCVSVPLAL